MLGRTTGMSQHHDAALDALSCALDALSCALDALLVALVALDGIVEVDAPADGLDVALAHDDAYQIARVEFRQVCGVLQDLLADEVVFFEVEAGAHALATASADVGLRLGISMAARSHS